MKSGCWSGVEANLITCPMAIIAYSMGQIIKPVCRVSVCVHSNKNTLAFLDGFSQKLAQTQNPKIKNEFVGVNTAPSIPLFCPKNISGKEVLKIHANINNNPITALNVRESPEFPRLTEYRGRVEEHDIDVRF